VKAREKMPFHVEILTHGEFVIFGSDGGGNFCHSSFTKAKLVYSTSDNSKPWGWAAHEKGICRPDGGS